MPSSTPLFDDLSDIRAQRHRALSGLNALIDVLVQAESKGDKASGSLGLERQIELLLDSPVFGS